MSELIQPPLSVLLDPTFLVVALMVLLPSVAFGYFISAKGKEPDRSGSVCQPYQMNKFWKIVSSYIGF